MTIKSLDELRKLREENSDRVRLRELGDGTGDRVEILIGMATCGISSGARDTLNEFVDLIMKEKMDHVKVIPVGCIGYCHSEPTVLVNMPGKKPVLYGNVKGKIVKEIMEKHIIGGQPQEKWVLNMDFERA